MQGQYSARLVVYGDDSQTVASQEIKNTNFSIHAASDNTQVNEGQSFDLSERKTFFFYFLSHTGHLSVVVDPCLLWVVVGH